MDLVIDTAIPIPTIDVGTITVTSKNKDGTILFKIIQNISYTNKIFEYLFGKENQIAVWAAEGAKSFLPKRINLSDYTVAQKYAITGNPVLVGNLDNLNYSLAGTAITNITNTQLNQVLLSDVTGTYILGGILWPLEMAAVTTDVLTVELDSIDYTLPTGATSTGTGTLEIDTVASDTTVASYTVERVAGLPAWIDVGTTVRIVGTQGGTAYDSTVAITEVTDVMDYASDNPQRQIYFKVNESVNIDISTIYLLENENIKIDFDTGFTLTSGLNTLTIKINWVWT